VLTIGDEASLVAYGQEIVNELRAQGVRAEGDFGTDKINGKVLRAEEIKVHTMLVIGGREKEAQSVAVRLHGKGNVGAKAKAEAIAEIVEAIRQRRA
jgi:threonyl-tRNA synthetase